MRLIPWCAGIFLVLFPFLTFSQGSWDPAGADHSYPRTLLDSLEIEGIRASLAEPGQLSLYASVWMNAINPVPEGNAADQDRIARAMIAKEAAFVVLMNRKYEAGSIALLPQEMRDSLVAKSVSILGEINTEVGFEQGWVFYREWQHRSKELITYLIAYDLLRGAGVSGAGLQKAEDSLVAFTKHLYSRAMATYTVLVFQLKFFSFQFNNHSIMTASALGLAAILFNNRQDPDPDGQPLNWINAGLWNLDNTLWVENGTYPRVSEPDTLAGYAEGPAYFEYGFQNAFPFIRAMGNFLENTGCEVTFSQVTRSVPNPWYDPRYLRLYDWINKIRMPDGSLPAIHDSPVGFGTVITALSGRPEYNLENPVFTPNDPFIRTQYIASHVPYGIRTDSLFQPLPEAGSLVFRSSWDTNAVYMHFIGKHGTALTGAKSHHQGDATSFSLFAYGQLLALDPGYPGAAQSDAVNKATDHNLILVNGYGPQPPLGEFVNEQTNTAFIEHFFDTPAMDYGEVRSEYLGVNFIRKVLFIRSRYYILSDFVSSPTVFDYTFQLHGNGLLGSEPFTPEGSFLPGTAIGSCMYRRDSVTLLALIQSGNGSVTCSNDLDSLATGEPAYRHYTKFLATVKNEDSTVFQSILFPYCGEAPSIRSIRPGSHAISARIRTADHNEVAFSTLTGQDVFLASDSSGLTSDVRANGSINFISETGSGILSSAFIQSGDLLFYGQKPWIVSGKRMNIEVEFPEDGRIAGYVSDSGNVRLHSPVPVHVEYGPVAVCGFDPGENLVSLSFYGEGNFLLAPGTGIGENRTDKNLFEITVFPNPSADGHFTVSVTSKAMAEVTCSVSDLGGKELITAGRVLRKGENHLYLDLSGFPGGFYILKILSPQGRAHFSLIRL